MASSKERNRNLVQEFRENKDVAKYFKLDFPNEFRTLLKNCDNSEWCSWSYAYTTWIAYKQAYMRVKLETESLSGILG